MAEQDRCDIKVEVEVEDCEEEAVITNLRSDQPLALVKRRERDITERFPYIDEVTTTTPTARSDLAVEDAHLGDSPDNTVTSSVDKGNILFLVTETEVF